MAESLFDIFGDHITRQAIKNVSRQPLSNIGKTFLYKSYNIIKYHSINQTD